MDMKMTSCKKLKLEIFSPTSTKYVTFSGKNQGLFGVKVLQKFASVDVTTIASIEKSKKE